MSPQPTVTAEPRAELVEKARELVDTLNDTVLYKQAAIIAAALANVEREAERREQAEAAETLQREIGVAWHDAEAALARKVRFAAIAELGRDGVRWDEVTRYAAHPSHPARSFCRALLAALDALPAEPKEPT